MIKVYDEKMNYIKAITSFKNLKIVEELNNGYKICQFSVPYSIGCLKEEQKIEIDNYIYVIKEVNMEKNTMYDVYCNPYYGMLTGKAITNGIFSGTISSIMSQLLTNTDWKFIEEEQITGTYSISLNNRTMLQAIKAIKGLFGIDIFYDTKNKEIHAWRKRGEYKSAFFLTSKNLSECKIQSNTYDLITRLYPIGKDSITIAAANNNSPYLECNDYCEDIITGFYVESGVESPLDLLNIAKLKLKEVSRPHTTYSIKLTQFDTSLEVGDSIKIIDDIKGIKQTLRINKIVYYPFHNEKSYVEIGDKSVSFKDIYNSFEEAQEIVNGNFLNGFTLLNREYSEV